MFNRIFPIVFILALAIPAPILADGNINLAVPIDGRSTFNLGAPVASVSTAEVIFTVDAVDSVFDCEGSTTYFAPILFVGFDDEGLSSSPPMLQYVGEPEDAFLTLPMQIFDANAWDILADGVATIETMAIVTTEQFGCTPISIGSMDFLEDKVTVHLVYTSVAGEEIESWSDIKVMYR